MYLISSFMVSTTAKLNHLFPTGNLKTHRNCGWSESSEDTEKTLIFSRPKPKTPSKSTLNKKGVSPKIILQKETATSTVVPSNKGKEEENLPTEEQMQNEPKGLPVEENDPKVLLRIIHNFTSWF